MIFKLYKYAVQQMLFPV